MQAHRALVFPVAWNEHRLEWLLTEFRVLVNESIRAALKEDARSHIRLARAAYADLSARLFIHKKYISSAFEVALSILKAHRRRLRKGKKSSVPYMRKLMLRVDNQSYWLDRDSGRIRIPIRGTEGVQLQLPLSNWHRSILSNPSGTRVLSVTPGKIIVVVRQDPPLPFEPRGAIALDTNEDSLDGVIAERASAVLLRIALDGVRLVQATHFRR